MSIPNNTEPDTSVHPRKVSSSISIPTKSTNVIKVNESTKIHLCMYGSSDTKTWNGDICDRDEIASSCKLFKPIHSPEESKSFFLENLSDDKFVYDNYRDLATLQWVLNDRIYKKPLSLFERFIIFLSFLFLRIPQPSKAPPLPPLSEDLWEDE